MNAAAVLVGDARARMRELADRSVDHVVADPPYSAKTHAGVRSHGRKSLRGGDGKVTARMVDLGFRPATRADISDWCSEIARVARRWVLIFSDFELAPTWRRRARERGLRYVQTCVWDRVGGAPQFDGRGPAAAIELILAFHARGDGAQPRRWNAGGKRGIYTHPIVANRLGQRGSRLHRTQKPVGLMVELLEDFTDAGELVLDPFAGSGTTGVACARLGRRFLGFENDPAWAKTALERIAAEARGSSLQAARAGQQPLFTAKQAATEHARRARRRSE